MAFDPSWLALISAAAGSALIAGEVAVRVVIAVRGSASKQLRLSVAALSDRMAALTGRVTSLEHATVVEHADDRRSLLAARAATAASGGEGNRSVSTGEAARTAALGLLEEIARKNVFLAVGALLVLLPLLVTSGYSISIGQPTPTPTPTSASPYMSG